MEGTASVVPDVAFGGKRKSRFIVPLRLFRFEAVGVDVPESSFGGDVVDGGDLDPAMDGDSSSAIGELRVVGWLTNAE